jgi:hypothetical protein
VPENTAFVQVPVIIEGIPKAKRKKKKEKERSWRNSLKLR